MTTVTAEKAAIVNNVTKEEPTEPWKPALILKVNNERPGFRQKWVRRDLTDRFLAEGWAFSKGTEAPKTIIDGTPLDSSVQKRELVLMEIPEARAKARDAYFKKLTDSNLEASAEEFKSVAGEGTGRSYGEIKISVGGG